MELIRRLADGAWHAGPELASELGVSRAAIWKQIRRARAMGLEVQAVRGRGYRLKHAFQPLDADAIRRGLSSFGVAQLDRIEVFSSVDSTSSYLARADASSPCRACFAEHQTGGRGRRGRRWVSPYGANLYLSLAWSFAQTPATIGALGLAVGVELAECLQGFGAADVRLKWPNDLLVDGDKLGGILIEHRGEAAAGCRVIVGVGLNVAMATEQADGLDQPWTPLAAHMETLPERNRLAAGILDALLRAMRRFQTDGFESYRARWQRLDAAAGHCVTLEAGSERIIGRATGVAADGALLVDVAGRAKRFYSGDLSLRITGA